MPARPSTGLPRRGRRAGDVAAVADERSGQGRGDPRPPPPDHGPSTPAARPEDPVHPGRPRVARRTTAPTPPRCARPDRAAGATRNRAALAPRPRRRVSRPNLPPETGRPAPPGPVHPHPGPTPGPGEQSRGYRRIHGEPLVPGVNVAASIGWKILHDAETDPAPDRTTQRWATFLRSQAEAILAADLFETVTLTGARMYLPAVIEHATRTVRSSALPPIRAPHRSPKPCATSPWTYTTPAAAPASRSATGTASIRRCPTPSSPAPTSRSSSPAYGYPG